MKLETVVPIKVAARSIIALASALVRKLIRADSLARVAGMAKSPKNRCRHCTSILRTKHRLGVTAKFLFKMGGADLGYRSTEGRTGSMKPTSWKTSYRGKLTPGSGSVRA